MSKYKSKYKGYPTYKGSGVEWIGEVPEHWEVKPAYAVAIVRNGYPFKSELFKREGVESDRLIRIRDIAGDDESIFTKEVCPDSATISNGDVLIGMDGDFNVHRWRRGPAKLNQRMCAASGRTEAITQFLSRCLPTPLRVINDLAYATTVKHLSSYEILHTRIAVPPTHELTNINVVLDRETTRIDALITKKTRFIELLQEKRSALITHAVTKGLDPEVKMKDSGVEWIGEVPEHWTITKLKHVSRTLIGLTYAPEDVVDDGTGITVLRSSNIQDGQLDLADIVQVRAVADPELMVRVGDILICSRNGSRALIGKNIQLDERSLGCTFGAFMTVVRGSFNDFLYYVFNSTMFDANSALYMTSTVNQLTISMIANMEVPLPPEEEQRAIVSHLRKGLSSLDVLLFKTQRSIDLLKERRSALITAAVTGKIDVRGWVPNALPQTHDLKGANT